jgi:hypothetical protein
MSAVFPAVSVLSCRHPLLLLPGCSGVAPRALTGRDDSRSPNGSGGESEVAFGASCFVPRLRSLSNSGRTSDFRSRRRNRSAPCVGNHSTDGTRTSPERCRPGLANVTDGWIRPRARTAGRSRTTQAHRRARSPAR